MINLDNKTLRLYNDELLKFEDLLSSIKSNYIESRNKFLLNNFVKKSFFREECIYSFINQFIDFLGILVFSKNDKDVILKLIELGFSFNLENYMEDIESIEKEIKRLEKIDGLLIFPHNYLAVCYNCLTTKFMIEAIDKFVGCDYNGIETNKIHLDFTKRKRRKNYKNPKNTKPNKNEFESLMNELLEKFEKFEFSNLYAKTLMGNYGFLKNSLIFKTNGISKRQVYYELFPLLMLIIKDKKIFNEIEFHEIEIESIYYNNYRLYRISKVRDILNLK